MLDWRIPHHYSYFLRVSTEVLRMAPLMKDGRRACVRCGLYLLYCAQHRLQLRIVNRTDSGAQSVSREQWAENKHDFIRFRRTGRKVVFTPVGTETRSGNAHT